NKSSFALLTMTRLSSSISFFFNNTATTQIYTLSLHDALPISVRDAARRAGRDRQASPPQDAHRLRSPHTLHEICRKVALAFSYWLLAPSCSNLSFWGARCLRRRIYAFCIPSRLQCIDPSPFAALRLRMTSSSRTLN